jgi:hypothetical protein
MVLLTACGKDQKADFQWEGLTVSGEFLFEGPNTLQGNPNPSLEAIAKAVGTEPAKIKKIYLTEAAITFTPDSLSPAAESVLLQWVGTSLDLVALANKSPIEQKGVIQLDIKQDQDILPYIKDATSTLVVDVNLNQDLDYFEGQLALKLNIVYKN